MNLDINGTNRSVMLESLNIWGKIKYQFNFKYLALKNQFNFFKIHYVFT